MYIYHLVWETQLWDKHYTTHNNSGATEWEKKLLHQPSKIPSLETFNSLFYTWWHIEVVAMMIYDWICDGYYI